MNETTQELRNKLNSVSNCFCLAKWTGVTMHLESGTTHSCHHPPVHQVPLDELKISPTALHNTRFKIEQRMKMMTGIRPSECDYCWKIEDLATNETSDRFIKSSEDWSINHFDDIINKPYDPSFKPKYVEVSFSNKCQLKCSYCSANYSSSWEAELLKFGDYSSGSGSKNVKIYEEEVNPYVTAFWEWWPELKKGLNTFRITGGEPMLSPSTFKVLENLIENPEPNLNLAINSNLNAPAVLIEKFNRLAAQIINNKSVKTFELYTSIDAYGKQAEYIRNGFDHERFWNNIELYLQGTETGKISIMCTFNALSITSFELLLKKIMELNLKYRNEERKLPVYIDISFLRHPEYQSVLSLPKSYIPEMQKIVDFIYANQWFKTADNVGFHEDQYIKSKRILEWMKTDVDQNKKNYFQKTFYSFFSEHDQRRNTNFINTFPEMKEFWEHCRSI